MIDKAIKTSKTHQNVNASARPVVELRGRRY